MRTGIIRRGVLAALAMVVGWSAVGWGQLSTVSVRKTYSAGEIFTAADYMADLQDIKGDLNDIIGVVGGDSLEITTGAIDSLTANTLSNIVVQSPLIGEASTDSLGFGVGRIDTLTVDTLSVTSAALYGGPVTVGADGAGYDVNAYGGTSGARLVWDASANTLVLTEGGGLMLGMGSQRATGGITTEFQMEGTGTADTRMALIGNSSDAVGPGVNLAKSRGAALGSSTIVQDGDVLGFVQFLGADGTDLATAAASIQGVVDGTPGANVMPGAVVINTTRAGAGSTTETARFAANGNVGIGTASPGGALTVNYDPSTTNGLELWDSRDANDLVQLTNSGGDLYIYAEDGGSYGSEAMVITSGGSVGIGGAPDASVMLESAGPILIDDSSPNVYFETDNGRTNWRLSAQENVNSGFEIEYGSDKDASAGDDTYSTALTIDSTGNVGIGTSPTSIFHVLSPTNATVRLDAGGNGNVNIIGTPAGTGTHLDIYQGTSDDADTNDLRIGGGGDVTDSRGAYTYLHGNEHATRPGVMRLSAGNVTGGEIQLSTGGAEVVTVDEDGNVGIGTSSPQVDLHIQKNGGGQWPVLDIINSNTTANAKPMLRVGQDTTNAALEIFRIGNLPTMYLNANQPSTGAIQFQTGGGQMAMHINGSQNIGIGTASPGEPLEVQRDQNAATRIKLENATDGTASSVGFDITGPGGRVISEVYAPSYTTIGKYKADSYLIETQGGTDGGFVISHGASVGDLELWVGGGQALTVDQSQNVGIGETSPSARLDVYDNTATANPVLEVTQDNASATGPALKVTHDASSGSVVQVGGGAGFELYRSVTIAGGDSLNLSTLLQGVHGLLDIIESSGNCVGTVYLRGGDNAVSEMADGMGCISTTKGTGSSRNIYYGSAYYLENQSGSLQNYVFMYRGF